MAPEPIQGGQRVFAWFKGYEAPLTSETLTPGDAADLAEKINAQPDWTADLRDAFGDKNE
jgi:hypothetical protein